MQSLPGQTSLSNKVSGLEALRQEYRTLWRSRALVWVLVQREVAARHAGAAGGLLWLYAQPLLTIAAYYLVFDVVFAMRLSEGAPTRAAGAFLIVGSVPWMAFCDAISRGMNSLVEGGHLLQKNPLPPGLLPVRSVFASAQVFGPLLLGLIVAYAPAHHFQAPLLLMVPLLALQLAMALVLGYLLAIAAAALRDTVQITAFVLSMGVFMSPVLFPMDMFPKDWIWVLWLNPITPVVLAYQQILLKGAWPPLEVWPALFAWLAITTVLLNVALTRSRDQLVDWL